MDPITLAALIGGAISLATTGASAAQQAAAASQANDLMSKAAAEWGIPLQEVETMMRDYGIPESALGQLRESSKLIDQQQGVYDELEGIARAKGNDPAFQAAIQKGINAAGQSYSANSGAVMRQLQGSGMQNSPLKYALLQQQGADAANIAGNAGLDAAGMAQQRYMAALEDMEGISGRMRDQDFRANTTRLSAIDEQNRWNKQMAFNAANQQMNAIQQNNQAKMQRAAGKSNALAGQASQVQGAANAMGGNLQAAGGQMAQLGLGVGQSIYGQQQRSKWEDAMKAAGKDPNLYLYGGGGGGKGWW